MLHVSIKTSKSIIITIILRVGVYLVCREQRKKYLITETIGYPREPGGGGGGVWKKHFFKKKNSYFSCLCTSTAIPQG